MSVSRLSHITRIGVEQMGDLADSLKDPEVLRLENLDTDLRPPQSALDYTKRLLELGKIAATPMVNWGGANSDSYVRFVFANEPVQRLRGVGTRVRRALT